MALLVGTRCAWKSLVIVREREKLTSLLLILQGMQAQITKAVLSQALLFGIKDLLEACERLFSSHSHQSVLKQPACTDVVLSLIYYSKLRGAAVGIKKL